MSSRMSRKYFCDCARFCKRGRDVSRATFYAHAPFRFNPVEDEEPRIEATDTGTAILAEVLNGILDIPNKAGEMYADAPRLITGGPWAIDGDGEQTQSPNPLQIYDTNGPGHTLHHNQGDGRSSSPAGQIQRPGRGNTPLQVHLVGGEDHSDGTVEDKEDNANLALDDHRNGGHLQMGQKATNNGTGDAPDSACKVKDALKHRHYECIHQAPDPGKEGKGKENTFPSHMHSVFDSCPPTDNISTTNPRIPWIANASHRLLLRAKNRPYTDLYNDYHRLHGDWTRLQEENTRQRITLSHYETESATIKYENLRMQLELGWLRSEVARLQGSQAGS
ncbi:hypothetical protein CCMSSC00406_0001047 [Pleurotus cornucopiae]|uniref:Uncharacterized protein n=1 Tax=Pleurotus cornucopiae TaxID=5321 RepID=A0ACB7IM82_PLECO|nr:hypothetical protein CCMSSC00406_0001047 [Pleurotus cornucopiae]